MSVQVQVHARSTKIYLNTHTTASVSSVEEQLNDSYIMNNFDTYFFSCLCESIKYMYFLANYNFYVIFVLVCNMVNIFILVSTSCV